MEELRGGRRGQAAARRVRARSFLGAAAISASLTPAGAFLTHQQQCHGAATRATPNVKSSEKKSCWGIARGSSSLRRVRCLPAHTEEEREWHFKPLNWPPLVRRTPGGGGGGGGSEPKQQAEARESGLGGESADVLGLTRSKPRSYQVELFRSVMESERNSLVYLPTVLGKTVVAGMVLKRLLDLNPGRQAFFLVDTTALAVQQVRVLPAFPSSE